MMRTRNRLSLLKSGSPVHEPATSSCSLMPPGPASSDKSDSPEPTDLSTCRVRPIKHPEPPENRLSTYNVLIGAGAGKASAKLPELIERITSQLGANLKLILSKAASKFVEPQELSNRFPNILSIHHQDNDEDASEQQPLYIELRNWAHLFLVAPMDANTLSKVAHGQQDNLLTAVARCWDVSKPLVFSPSIDVCTYSNPLTLEHLTKLRLLGFQRVDCWEQLMSSPNYGHGFMASPETVVDRISEFLCTQTAASMKLKPDENNLPSTRQQLLTTLNKDHQLTSKSNTLLQPTSICEPLSATSNRHKLQSLKSRLRSRHALDNAKSIRNLKAFELKMEVDSMVEPPETTTCSQLAKEHMPADAIQHSDEEDDDDDQSSLLAQDTVLELFPRKFSSYPTNLPPVDPTRNSLSATGEGDDNSSSSSSGSTTAINSKHNHLDLAALGLDTSKFLSICQNRELSCYTCAICKNNYKNRKSMARHLKEQHIQGSIFHCKQCGVSYKRREKLLKHNRERHSRPQTSLT